MTSELAFLLEREAFIICRRHPHLRGTMQRAARAGKLVRLLPGVLAAPEAAALPQVRCAALQAVAPDAVFVAETAGALYGWNPHPQVLQCAGVKRPQAPGFDFSQRKVPAELIGWLGQLRITSPELTVLDLARSNGTAAIDDGLRRGVRLAGLWEALELTAGREGNEVLRRMLHDSRDQPWSAAERAAHRALREAGIAFRANHRVRVGERSYFLDVALPGLRLGIEIDGYEFHSGRAAFDHDRERDTQLAGAGWQICRFPASMLLHTPERFIEEVRRIIRVRRRMLCLPA